MVQTFQRMNNIGQYILKSQNESFQIDQLLAQKKIYSNAKFLQGILIFITIPLPIILALLIKHYPEIIDEKNSLFVLYLITAALTEKILESYISRFKKIAASIQEKFDLFVLKIPENKTLNTATVDNEIIRHFSKKAKKKKLKKVTNWYSLKINTVNTNIASLLCQRTNVYYDFSVRNRYNWLVRIFVIITFFTLMMISLNNDISLKSFLIEVLLPTIPVFMFAYKEINSNTESIDNLKHLKSLIETSLENLNINENINLTLLREIQNRIYANRILSPLIPDIIYKIIRPRLEDEMNYSVEQKIKELMND